MKTGWRQLRGKSLNTKHSEKRATALRRQMLEALVGGLENSNWEPNTVLAAVDLGNDEGRNLAVHLGWREEQGGEVCVVWTERATLLSWYRSGEDRGLSATKTIETLINMPAPLGIVLAYAMGGTTLAVLKD
jgi:hypothetical protein